MKTEGMSQQIEALRRMNGKKWYALFMEQGTGKTWSFLGDCERYYTSGKIDAVFVLAPNGVHTNWVLREIPAHLECLHIAAAWRSGMGKRERAKLDETMLTPTQPGLQRPLRILTMNYEALQSADALNFAAQFMRSTKCMFILDESQKIKNAASAAYKNVMKLEPHSVARRIGTGTPMDKPQDIFSQMEFLEPGLLGTSSYRAFMAEFAVLADWKEPKRDADWAFKRQVKANPRMANAIIIARDDDTGQPMYRNLEKLNRMIAEHSYRVLKKDCMDLPEKIYQSVYFDLTPKQRAAYDLMEDQFRIELEDGTITPVSALASLVKLQQITSGYIVVPGEEELLYIGEKNPRIDLVTETVCDIRGKVIVWAKFREEISALAASLRKAGRVVVEYHGGIKPKERDDAIESLQNGNADVFLGVQKAGGTGLTLTAAETTIYCSNEHSAIVRLQSEDRNHRKGTINHYGYIDVVASGTIDDAITRAHQWKTALASTVLGDRKLDLRGFL